MKRFLERILGGSSHNGPPVVVAPADVLLPPREAESIKYVRLPYILFYFIVTLTLTLMRT